MIGLVQERRLELPRRLPHAPQTCLSTIPTLLHFLKLGYYTGKRWICQLFFIRTTKKLFGSKYIHILWFMFWLQAEALIISAF